ncbi:hypothetical protein [Sphingopyxis sp.]|uniref:hypothetical protein n=1 Tax=Sphingopyxis sp. TaxID=1908224 RepID=UPI0010F90394|nr:hypothetical protein [Sphingopyxis sp.]MBR2174056.1 hypothetical protein [Sphingopyxis sp.]
MMRQRLFQSLLMLVTAVLLAAGPGSPFCTAAAAAEVDGTAMAGCDMSGPTENGPAEKTPLPAHPDCASPCIAIACRAPDIAPIPSTEFTPSNTAMTQLDGLDPAPEAEPPRS